jgi:hypothetical protein
MSEVSELKALLEQHINSSDAWRAKSDNWMDKTDLRMEDMQSNLARHNSYEVGANAIIWVGKAIIYILGVCGAAWMFFHDYIKQIFGK